MAQLPSPIDSARKNAQPAMPPSTAPTGPVPKATDKPNLKPPVVKGQHPTAGLEAGATPPPVSNPMGAQATLSPQAEKVINPPTPEVTQQDPAPPPGGIDPADIQGMTLRELTGDVPATGDMQTPDLEFVGQEGQTLKDFERAKEEKNRQDTEHILNIQAMGHDDVARNANFYPSLYSGPTFDQIVQGIRGNTLQMRGLAETAAANQAAQAIQNAIQAPIQTRSDPHQYHPDSTANPWEGFWNWLGLNGKPDSPFNPLKAQFGPAGQGVGGALLYGLGLLQNVPVGIAGDLKNARDRLVNVLPEPVQSILNFSPLNVLRGLEQTPVVRGVENFLTGQAITAQSVADRPDLPNVTRAVWQGYANIDHALAALPKMFRDLEFLHNTDDPTKPLHVVQALRGAQYSATYDKATRIANRSPIGIGGSDPRVPWYLDPGHILGAAFDIFGSPVAGAGLAKTTNAVAKASAGTRVGRVAKAVNIGVNVLNDPFTYVPQLNSVFKRGWKGKNTDALPPASSVAENPTRVPGAMPQYTTQAVKISADGPERIIPVPSYDTPVVMEAYVEELKQLPGTAPGGSIKLPTPDAPAPTPIIFQPEVIDAQTGLFRLEGTRAITKVGDDAGGIVQVVDGEPFPPKSVVTPQLGGTPERKALPTSSIVQVVEGEPVVPLQKVFAAAEQQPILSLPPGVDSVVEITNNPLMLPVASTASVSPSVESQILNALGEGNLVRPLANDASALAVVPEVNRGHALAVIRTKLEETRLTKPGGVLTSEDLNVAVDASLSAVPVKADVFEPDTLAHIEAQVPEVPARVFQGDITLDELAKHLVAPEPGTQINPANVKQSRRTLDDINALAKLLPGEDGLPFVSAKAKKPLKTWQQVADRVAKANDPVYRRILDRNGPPIPADILGGQGFRITRRSGGLDGSPRIQSIVDMSNVPPTNSAPPVKRWVDPSYIEPKFQATSGRREPWRQELESNRDTARVLLQKELAKPEPNSKLIEDLVEKIDDLEGQMYHPDVVNDPRALRAVQKELLPVTHRGTKEQTVQATQEFIDSVVDLGNHADEYHLAQLEQQSIQQSLEISTQNTMALPDIGREVLPNNIPLDTPPPRGIPEVTKVPFTSVEEARAAFYGVDVVAMMDSQLSVMRNIESALSRMQPSDSFYRPTLNMLNDRSSSGLLIVLGDLQRMRLTLPKLPAEFREGFETLMRTGSTNAHTMWNSASRELKQEFWNILNKPERAHYGKLASEIGIQLDPAHLQLVDRANSQTFGFGSSSGDIVSVIGKASDGIEEKLPRGITVPGVQLHSNLETARNHAVANVERNAPTNVEYNAHGTVIEVKPNLENPLNASVPMLEEQKDLVLNALENTLDIGDPLERKVFSRLKKELAKPSTRFADVPSAFAVETVKTDIHSEVLVTKFQRNLAKELKANGFDGVVHSNPDGTTTIELLDTKKVIPLHKTDLPPVSPIEEAAARFNADSTTSLHHPDNLYHAVDFNESSTQLAARMSQNSDQLLREAEQRMIDKTNSALDAYEKLGDQAKLEKSLKQAREDFELERKFEAQDKHLNSQSKNPCDL